MRAASERDLRLIHGRRIRHAGGCVLIAVLGLFGPGAGGETAAAAQQRSLDLPRIPWEGGSNYYAQFPKARASGWDRPGFFPISVFLGRADPATVAQYKTPASTPCSGSSTIRTPFRSPTSPTAGSSRLCSSSPRTGARTGRPRRWGPTRASSAGSPPTSARWATAAARCTTRQRPSATPDTRTRRTPPIRTSSTCTAIEPSAWPSPSGTPRRAHHWITRSTRTGTNAPLELAYQRHLVNQLRNKRDGRFVAANFGNGVARTFWSPNTMDAHYQAVDFSAADKYAYTSEGAGAVFTGGGFNSGSKDWPADAAADRAGTYGFIADQFQRFADPSRRTPIGVAIETGRPFIDSSDCSTPSCMITPGQLRGAVWSAIIHEARHILYFDHSNGSRCGSIANCPVVHEAVKQVDHRIAALAPGAQHAVLLHPDAAHQRHFIPPLRVPRR